MSQARVKALKFEGKTTSRKAIKSGRASGTASPYHSARLIHNVFYTEDSAPSRSDSEPSPPETPPLSDSDYEHIESGSDETPFDPQKLIAALRDHKSTQTESREVLLDHYVERVRRWYHCGFENLESEADDLLGIFLRGANRGATPRERLLSLQSYCLTASFVHVDKADSTCHLLKQIVEDDDDEECQIHALYALCQTIVYYGGGTNQLEDFLDFLIEVIQSNGDSINALDKDGVMVATFECWAFAACHVNVWHLADYAMDAFVEKLDSTNPEVQAIASECIAFIFEASRAHEEEEGEPFQLPYDPQRIASRINDLWKNSGKSRSPKGRRDPRESFKSVSTSLDLSVGPHYSTVVASHYYVKEKHEGQRTGEELQGYRHKLRRRDGTRTESQAYITSWNIFHRVLFLRNVFKGGLDRHLQYDNPMIVKCLEGLEWSPIIKIST